ncbi:MAG: hypothetical protein KDN20_17575 [Verrucomicrobiae bacterium]|nr:hypothetical protein [Verrucomicrobiae bacterium]
MIIGLDAEWQREGQANKLLSFQWSLLYRGSEFTGIEFFDGGRPRMADLIQWILTDAKVQGAFCHYPKMVNLVCHFSLAEFAMMADFQELKTRFDALRGSFSTLAKPLSFTITDQNRNSRQISVFLRDSAHLTPQGAKLGTLGEIHGFPKVALPVDAIENMELLLHEDRDLFIRYAITDAKIAARHALAMARLNRDLTGRVEIPATLGSLCWAFTLKWWEDNGIDRLAVLGKERIEDERFEECSAMMKKEKREVLLANIHQHETLAIECYHGGRNEAFYFGPTYRDNWIDVDLIGAYPTALASLGMPKWNELRSTTDINDFTHNVIGLARVRFRFPKTVRFPCLPVRQPNNLIFPLEGEAHATAAEIILAEKLGAAIEIQAGIVIPLDHSARPFEAVIAELARRRKQAKESGDDLRDKLFKELVNSIYGKTAQGLREKRVFDSRQNDHLDIKPSKLTQPFIAAHVTGLVRAALAEIMNSLPIDNEIVSVTTDGIITNATNEQLEMASRGTVCELFRNTRRRLIKSREIIEIKHSVKQILSFRTRGQATIETLDETQPPLLAKAGIKPPPNVSDKWEQNEWLVRQFFDRNSATTFSYERLRTLQELYKDGGDLIKVTHNRLLAMDFDFKRLPTLRWTQCSAYFPVHLAFRTRPFKNVAEYRRYRDGWKNFRASGRSLKSLQDLRAFEEYLAADILRSKGLRVSTGGVVKTALKQFLRRLVRGLSGLKGVCEGRSQKDIAQLFSQVYIKVTVDDLKNAGRPASIVAPNAIPRTPEVEELVEDLWELFPEWDSEEMLVCEIQTESSEREDESGQLLLFDHPKTTQNGVAS